MRLCFTLFVLLFTQLFLNLAHAAPNAGVNADQRKSQASAAKTDDRRKRKPVKLQKKTRSTESEHLGNPKLKSAVVKPRKAVATKTPPADTAPTAGKTTAAKTHAAGQRAKTKSVTSDKTAAVKVGKNPITSSRRQRDNTRLAHNQAAGKGLKKAYGRHRGGAQARTTAMAADAQPLRMSESHKVRYQHAKLTAMAKLMSQVGKPYRWGGKSPTTGFDCSGLIYYAYKDLIRVPLPRTANEMYHLRDAAPVKKSELESGDLVFFRIRNRGTADHVGVYLGNGRFIQSPRTGRDIRISYLSEDYWQDHYVGARRVMTPTTIR